MNQDLNTMAIFQTGNEILISFQLGIAFNAKKNTTKSHQYHLLEK